MILEMKSKIFPDTFNRLVVVMAMPCVCNSESSSCHVKNLGSLHSAISVPKV